MRICHRPFMATIQQRKTLAELLAHRPRSHAEQLGIDIASGAPAALARWLVACIVAAGGGVRAEAAAAATTALHRGKLTDPHLLAKARTASIARVLRNAGCARFDEQVAGSLKRSARILVQTYRGDLRGLREAAERNPLRERTLLKRLPGIGNTGADMFCREAQAAWPELRPFFDARTLAGAEVLGLPVDPAKLATLVPATKLHRLASALFAEVRATTSRARAG